MKSIDTVLRKLTLDDLREWAGGAILSRAKRYVNQVDQLSRTRDGALAAWVTGNDRYATSVRLDEQRVFAHFCTCPYYQGPCKHAVAVVLAGAERMKRKEPIPALDEGGDLSRALGGDTDVERDWADDDKPARSPAPARAKVAKLLGDKSRETLLELLVALARRYPEVERHILEAEHLASGQVPKLVRALRAEIRNLTAEEAWYNHWRGQGNRPDYTHLGEQLQALIDQGHADAVIELGAELWSKGKAQVEQSDDEGETAMAIAGCMETVTAALPQSSLSAPEQLLWVIDRLLEDEFSLLESGEDLLKRRAYTQAHWQEIAGILQTRLEALPKPRPTVFLETYRRERLLNRLIEAYAKAGWKIRIIPLLEAEADACRCYGKLVDALLADGERDRARQWCMHGYVRTVEDAPGIARTLQERLRTIAQGERRPDLVAAYLAQDFFGRPSGESYKELRKAAEKAKCWSAVRAATLRYLETGERPTARGQKDGQAGWPLPAPEVEPPASRRSGGDGRFPGTKVDPMSRTVFL